MEIFGICYLIVGLLAVAGCVLDADEPKAFIRNLPDKKTDRLCSLMYKYILAHRPYMVQKIDFGPLPITNIPKDRIYDIDFRINEEEVQNLCGMSPEQMFVPGTPIRIPIDYHADCKYLNHFISLSVRQKIYEHVLDFVSVRAAFNPGGSVSVNAELVVRQPESPQFAWVDSKDDFLTEKRFKQ